MIIKPIIAGIYEEVAYIVMDEDTKDAFIVDPGGNGELIEAEVKALDANIKYILITHGHFDHVGAVEYIADKFNVPFYISKEDEEWISKDNYVFGNLRKADGYLSEGDSLKIGNKDVKVISTPGHTPGGLCFLVGKDLFTGDTLFRGSVGRTDFPGGNSVALITSIKKKLVPLEDDIRVYPGHGDSSTIGFEKEINPYL
ncbi:MBL fold metallo-hydrolase [uncultured Clostridium sp.]|uniref:MBL fold metallo-hydrolase n=1 Tax=uncultured Clostridium sp. TaxID=59620 RepID=UPI0025D5CF8C|nr:MBL fold metallo-hydrolase [uncultured Clostridium sp.]